MILYESFNEIHSICREYEIDDYTINSDGSIDVDGNVYLDHTSLTKLPLNFNKVKGDFECNNNQLTTLEGGPKEVDGYFSCLSNKLTSLKGGPKSVGGYYDCNANRLTSLEFIADEIGESLFCAQNNLTTLKGCPEKINGAFHTHYNQLTSLEYGPKLVEGDFVCKSNYLTTLKGCPENIDGEFDCGGNLNLSDLKDFDSKFSGLFLCMNTNLHFLDKQEYNCISMFRRLNIIDGDTIYKKRLMYLHSIFNFKFFKIDDVSKIYNLI
tara:strand:+ start:2878 stop:3678 length:801 start_codon:yes stop_codon:yes gene_type:complete